jgi:hypothetical protein
MADQPSPAEDERAADHRKGAPLEPAKLAVGLEPTTC